MKAVVTLSGVTESIGSIITPQNVIIEEHRIDHRIDSDEYLYVYGVDEDGKRVSTLAAAPGKWSHFIITEGASL